MLMSVACFACISCNCLPSVLSLLMHVRKSIWQLSNSNSVLREMFGKHVKPTVQNDVKVDYSDVVHLLMQVIQQELLKVQQTCRQQNVSERRLFEKMLGVDKRNMTASVVDKAATAASVIPAFYMSLLSYSTNGQIA